MFMNKAFHDVEGFFAPYDAGKNCVTLSEP